MNDIQEVIFIGSREESGIWDVLTDIADIRGVDRATAFCLLKDEINFISGRDDIYLISSEKLYDSDLCKVMEKRSLLGLTLTDVEFKEKGPFYYLSNVPGI